LLQRRCLCVSTSLPPARFGEGATALTTFLRLQHMNGVETTRAIRFRETLMPYSDRPSIAVNGHLPIFACSAQVEPEQRREIIEVGFDGVLRKPINTKRLGVIVAGVLDPVSRKQGAL
jgi:CheY-like chemotaxis protein